MDTLDILKLLRRSLLLFNYYYSKPLKSRVSLIKTETQHLNLLWFARTIDEYIQAFIQVLPNGGYPTTNGGYSHLDLRPRAHDRGGGGRGCNSVFPRPSQLLFPHLKTSWPGGGGGGGGGVLMRIFRRPKCTFPYSSFSPGTWLSFTLFTIPSIGGYRPPQKMGGDVVPNGGQKDPHWGV